MAGVQWYIDGVPLKQGLVRDVETRAGWSNVTATAGQNLSVPNRAGEIFMPKDITAGGFSLSLWLFGASEDELRDEFDRLLRLVVQPSRMLTVQKVYPDRKTRVCRAELTGGIRPTVIGAHGMRATLTFRIPAGIWESQDTYTHQTVAGAPLPQPLRLTHLAQATAPMDNAILTIHGPITNPVVGWSNPGYDITERVTYSGTVPAGASLTLNSGTWGISGNGFPVNTAAVIPSGGRFLTIAHSSDPAVTLSGVGGGATTQLVVQSKAAFIA